MKRSLAIFLSVLLVTLGLLNVPVGLAGATSNPIGGVVITAIGALMMGLGVVLDRWIDRPQRRHHD
jgi:hypothetical protein